MEKLKNPSSTVTEHLNKGKNVSYIVKDCIKEQTKIKSDRQYIFPFQFKALIMEKCFDDEDNIKTLTTV